MDLHDAEAAFEHPLLEVDTLSEMFEKSVERHADRPAQQYKGGIYDRSLAGEDGPLEPAPDGEYATITYERMAELVRRLATGFRELGVAGGDRVGLFSGTRAEWALADFGVLAAGGVVTTVYKSSSPDQVRYLLDDPGASAVVVENADLLERVFAVEDDLDLEFVVVVDEVDGYGDRDDVLTLRDVYRRGAETFDRDRYDGWLAERDVDDLASLIYTSGTTGQPKGVMLSHRNLRANVNQIFRRYGPRPDRDDDVAAIDEEGQFLSFLPLAHVFERTCGHFTAFAAGATVAYAESPDTVQEDLATVEPNSMTSVPRVYEKVYDGIRERVSEDETKAEVFEWAVDVARRYQEADDPDENLESEMQSADDLVFEEIRQAVGGEIEFLVSGGGSLSPELCRLFHGMGLPILEGYGMTETAPVVATNPPEEPKVGTIGPVVHGMETKLDTSIVGESLEDEGTVGELLLKGPNVTEGYWNKPGATEGAFTQDVPGSEATGESEDSSSGRWFRTGDIVHERPDGYLEFRERAKQLVVLSTGKNVAPGPIEDAFASVDVVEQCMVVGDGEKFVGALIVPNVDALRTRAADADVSLPDDVDALVADEWVRERIDEAVADVNEGFESYETIKEYRLAPEEFTEDNDMLTPSMKKKRSAIRDRYGDLVTEIYADDETVGATTD